MDAGEFWTKVDKSGDCWIWTGPRDRLGYGRIPRIAIHGESVQLAHRAAYLWTKGPLSDVNLATRTGGGSYETVALDHLCRNASCVNPDHLDPCGQAENGRRQVWPEKCPKGHEYTPENRGTYRNVKGYEVRLCLECRTARDRARQRVRV